MKVKQSSEIPYEGDEVTRAARKKIDDDIEELQRRIQRLRTKRNELAPISVLPPEVLSTIFVIVRDLSIHGPYEYSSHPAPWMHTGYVCHHWREIALNCSYLWSTPVFARPDLAEEMMRRSKVGPLAIRSRRDALTPKVLEQLEKALGQVTRIQSIELKLEGHTQQLEGILSLLSRPTPLLENIFLVGPSHMIFPLDTLPDAPRLRSITFSCLQFSWESAVFKHRNLTSLRLTNTPPKASTISQMMDTLHQLPNLRVLALSHCMPPYTANDKDLKTLEFHFLKRLEFSAKATNCTFFLRHIRYPSSTLVDLHLGKASVEDGVTIISLLGKNLCRTQSTEVGIHHSPVIIRSATLTSHYNTVEIAFFNRADRVNWLNEAGRLPNILIHLDGDFTQVLGRLLTTIDNSFNLSSLERLLLDWNFNSNHIPAIRDSFGKLPKLKIIHVLKSVSEICIAVAGTIRDKETKKNTACDHLTQSQGTSQHSSLPVILFPALETLVVRGVEFRRRSQPQEAIHLLIDMLIKRSNINMPINNLSFKECRGVRTWQMRLLAGLVVHLDVGGTVIDVRSLESNRWCCDDYSSEDDEDEYEGDSSDDEGYFYHGNPRY